jgi:hypothetical protein
MKFSVHTGVVGRLARLPPLTHGREMSAHERPIFMLALRPLPGIDGIRALRRALKFLLRKFGLKVISIREQ